MRSLADATIRWQETLEHSSSLGDLQQAVAHNGPASPCVAGCRSVCWKAFLLSQTTDAANWSHALLESRSTYSSLRDHFLRYIKHPEYLNAGISDPLADDADSPWNTLRHDEALRAEILQDVQRLPDEAFYHRPDIQVMVLDILFIYCKLNPDVGGYRQGMHELLAPIVYVVQQDAIDPTGATSGPSTDLRMVEMLDASFIEHDAFALFSKVMDCAKPFYETGGNNASGASSAFGNLSMQSSIVEKSQYIHEVLLSRVDPELSAHLKDIEILPQVFLIRWIRLLFSREFPFDQMLILWDTLFAVDPSFTLIDLICTAMLIRIRWDLLNADYTFALQSLLKYTPPQAPHGPHTFVDDAAYLRDHLNPSGGSALIERYTGKPTNALPSAGSRPSTPKFYDPGVGRKTATAKSSLSPSASRTKTPPSGVEALFQGAAKGVLQRGEKLGINQAVRDAMVEIRRNMQEARTSIKSSRDLFSEPGPNTAMRAVAIMDRRNKRLATMLDESVSSLNALATSDMEDKQQTRDALEIAIAKIQLAKVYLDDSTLALPDDDQVTAAMSPSASGRQSKRTETGSLSDAVATMSLGTPMVIDSPDPSPNLQNPGTPKAATPNPGSASVPSQSDPLGLGMTAPVPPRRPQPPIPTRSTLAQSSFSWMLEPNDAASSSSSASPRMSGDFLAASGSADAPPRGKRHLANATRERTAFLFGEVPAEADNRGVRPQDIFGLEPIRKEKERG
ncbi:RabGAP/TBC [Xylariaceae sp. FL0804]|nr:RabGAP/TBC [Xylariaceae sp. FL0804]